MVKRDSYLKRLIHNMWNGEVKVITGIRRCGKSVMLFDLFYEYLLSQGVPEDHILKFELDQRRYYKYRNPITLCEYVEDAICDKKKKNSIFLLMKYNILLKLLMKKMAELQLRFMIC